MRSSQQHPRRSHLPGIRHQRHPITRSRRRRARSGQRLCPLVALEPFRPAAQTSRSRAACSRAAWSACSLERREASYSRSTPSAGESSRHRLLPETASLEEPLDLSMARASAKERESGGGVDLWKKRMGARRLWRSAEEAGNPRNGGRDSFYIHIYPERADPRGSSRPSGPEGGQG